MVIGIRCVGEKTVFLQRDDAMDWLAPRLDTGDITAIVRGLVIHQYRCRHCGVFTDGVVVSSSKRYIIRQVTLLIRSKAVCHHRYSHDRRRCVSIRIGYGITKPL